MEKLKQAKVNDLVKVLTPDEHLIPMKILMIDKENSTVLLGKPRAKITALRIGESVVLKSANTQHEEEYSFKSLSR